MNPRHPYGAVAVWCVVFFALVASVCAQEPAAPRHTGVPQDWSQRHIVFSRDALLQHPNLIYREPRVLHQAIQRWQGRGSNIFHGGGTEQTPSASSNQRDWKVNLQGKTAPRMFPAKFSFHPDALPSCANDYVVFGLTQIGVNGGQANLVAFNNLYAGSLPAGLCGAAPMVLFAYNITTVAGGRISTSPVLSLDGTKIAFVESIPGTTPSAIFHVLTWTGGEGTIGAAAAPTSMTSLTFSPVDNSTTSSPWVDYSADIAYLGADDGKVYKITGVFRGTPTLAGAPWPVTVSTNARLTPPVLDAGRGLLMVGSANGKLYQINTATGALKSLVVGLSGGGRINAGIWGAPIVDITNGTTFVVSANDGTSGVLVEADTATLTQLAKAPIGQASTNPAKTVVTLLEPAFSDSYYTDPSTGLVRLCGTGAADITPWQYAFGFTGLTMQTTPSFSQQLLTSTAARCTGWTEFFNPNVSGGTDFFFFGLTQDCTAPGTGTADGCVVARSSDTTITKATVKGGPSGIVVDNYSTAAQASSIYLTAENVQTGYKFTQNGLQ